MKVRSWGRRWGASPSCTEACNGWMGQGWDPLSLSVLGTAPKEQHWGRGGSHCPPLPPQGKGKMRTYWLLGERKDPKVI